MTDSASVGRALEGCDDAAGLPEQWLRDPATFERVNVSGTRNLVAAALEPGVERFVYTSTIDVFAAPRGAEYDESKLDPEPKGTTLSQYLQEFVSLRISVPPFGRHTALLDRG